MRFKPGQRPDQTETCTNGCRVWLPVWLPIGPTHYESQAGKSSVQSPRPLVFAAARATVRE
jgi:hypothetical protein